MRDDHTARRALQNLQADLKPYHFRARRTRDYFWIVIAGRFNGKRLELSENFLTSVPEADSSYAPLCVRSAEILKSAFMRTNALLTERFELYSASGSNDTDKWPEFLGPLDKEGRLATADMKRVWIFIIICKL